jgi:hypothetical protein
MSPASSARQARADHGPVAAGSSLRLYRNPLRQAVSASTWRATGFLLAYLVVGWLLFGAVLAAGIVTITLAITLAGIPLLIATAAVIRGCASAERGRLRGVLRQPERGSYRDVAGLGMLARVRASWTDPALWRDVAYLGGLFPVLWALDLAVLTVWLTFIGCITAPAWYWAPEQTYPGGPHRGLQFGYFPHGPHGPGAVGVYVDTLPKALVTAVVFLAASLLFQYVVVHTARLHARIAGALLGAPGDPLAQAKEVLERPGPLGPLTTSTQ